MGARRHRSPFALAFQLGSPGDTGRLQGPLSTLDPSGPAAASIATLWWVMLAGSPCFSLLVMVLFALVSCARAGASVRAAALDRARRSGAAGLVLVPLVAYGLVAGERLLPLPGGRRRASGWGGSGRWTFGYPDRAGETKACCTCPPAPGRRRGRPART